jgi:hypothetical protein
VGFAPASAMPYSDRSVRRSTFACPTDRPEKKGRTSMPDFDATRAINSFRELSNEFKRAGNLYPGLRHRLVEAPRDRLPEFAAKLPACSACYPSSSSFFRTYFEPNPPARGHHYIGINQDEDGADLETFQSLASRAADIIEGCPASTRLLLAVLDPGPRHPYARQVDGWMVIVHRLAWQNVEAQPLKTTPSTPAIEWESSVTFDPLGMADIGIPSDCRASTLPNVSVFQACAWAIDLIIEELGKVESAGIVEAKADELESARPDSDRVNDSAASAKKKKGISRKETNNLVRFHLTRNPDATVTGIQEKTGCSRGAISQSEAWRSTRRRKKPVTRISVDAMQETLDLSQVEGCEIDPSEAIDMGELIESQFTDYLTDNNPKELHKFKLMNSNDRRQAAEEYICRSSENVHDKNRERS